MQVSKLAPRFVPTLTEVIDPATVMPNDIHPAPTASTAPAPGASAATESSDALAQPANPPVAAHTERMVEQLMERLVPQMEEQVRKTLYAAVDLQAKALLLRVRQDLEASVRQAVKQALENAVSSKPGHGKSS